MKYMPMPVITHAMITAITEADAAMFCGRLKMPPPIIAETTRAASAITPSFLLSFESAMIYSSSFRCCDSGKDSADLSYGKGNQQITTAFTGFGFTMTVNNASVNLEETRFNVTLNNTSLIGFASNGTPRISKGNAVTQDVSLPHGKDSFVIGGLRKQETVKSRTGVPWLMDIPYLGYLFSTESNSVRHAELIVVGECSWDSPSDSSAAARSTRTTW